MREQKHQQDGYLKYDKDYRCWWFYPNNATGERFVVRHDPRDGTRLNADGTETPMCEVVRFANPTVGPVPCDFCGAKHSTPQCLPDLRFPEPPENEVIARWGHPLTGNVCRECAVKQMALASGGRLVERVPSEAVQTNGLYCLLRHFDAGGRVGVDDLGPDPAPETFSQLYHLGLVGGDWRLTGAGRTILAVLAQAADPAAFVPKAALVAMADKWHEKAGAQEGQSHVRPFLERMAVSRTYQSCVDDLEAALSAVGVKPAGQPAAPEAGTEEVQEAAEPSLRHERDLYRAALMHAGGFVWQELHQLLPADDFNEDIGGECSWFVKFLRDAVTDKRGWAQQYLCAETLACAAALMGHPAAPQPGHEEDD